MTTRPSPGARQAALYNRYAPLGDFHHVVGSSDSLERLKFPSSEGDIQADNLLCFVRKQTPKSDATTIPPAEKASNGLLTHLTIDAAAVLAAHILQVVPGENVLDLCATQADNSVILAQSIWPYLQPDSPTPPLIGAKKGALHSAQLKSVDEGRHLASTLAEYLPASVATSGQQKVIRVDGFNDASELPLGLGGYDKVLVDVTCFDRTSQDKGEDRVKALMKALSAVRIGGRVVYVARSLATEESDDVVARAILQIEQQTKSDAHSWTAAIERLDAKVEQQLETDWAEKTAKGWAVSPDHARGGWGPLYFSVLTKKEVR